MPSHARPSTAARHREAPRRSRQKTGRTKSYYARQAILAHLEDMEDIALAEERLKSDHGVRIALEDVMREIDAREAEDGGKSTAAE